MSETGAERTLGRMIVCVKACEGIPSHLLEDGFLARLVAACLHLEDARVQDVLAELVAAVKPRKRPPSPGTSARTDASFPGVPGHPDPIPDSAAQGSLRCADPRFAWKN